VAHCRAACIAAHSSSILPGSCQACLQQLQAAAAALPGWQHSSSGSLPGCLHSWSWESL